MNLYARADWIRFREDVIKLEGGKCGRCLRSRADGVILQVHHKHYIAGRKPWDYAYDECETLCRGCHGAEHGKVMPRRGWECIGYDDLGDLIGECELCGTDLRYLYLIQHPKWPAMEVGTDCCDNLTGSADASEHLDAYKKRTDRMKRFASSQRWKTKPSGELAIKQAGIAVAIVKAGGAFKIVMDGAMGKAEYSTILDAKMRVFEAIDTGEAAKFLEARQAKLAAQSTGRRYRRV